MENNTKRDLFVPGKTVMLNDLLKDEGNEMDHNTTKKDDDAMKEILKEITRKFDDNCGGLNLRLNTLEKISIEMNAMAEVVTNTDVSNINKMGYAFNDIKHKIELLAELLNYTVEDLDEELERTRIIKESYFDFHVRGINDNE